MKIRLGFSPCPNDTFIFDALVNRKIDWQGLDFEFVLGDVEELNHLAFKGDIEVTKLSYYTFAQLIGKYQILDAGGALGFNCGPLLVAKEANASLANPTIAIPGFNTTANLLLSLAHPKWELKEAILFSDIEDAVLSGKYDLGLIIHESRFTYEHKGLYKVQDLGEFWQERTQSPIPLGGIAIQSEIAQEVKDKVNNLIQESVEMAFATPEGTMEYVLTHSQEMTREVVQKHIELYVNKFSIQLGEIGRAGVERFLEELVYEGKISPISKKVFANG